MNLAPARKAAFAALLAVDRGAWSAEALATKSVHLDSRDASLASDIVFGVLRRRGELDGVIRRYSKVPPERLDPEVWIALEMAFYQMRFLDRVPSHAAVNDAVELYGVPAPPLLRLLSTQSSGSRFASRWKLRRNSPPQSGCWIAGPHSTAAK